MNFPVIKNEKIISDLRSKKDDVFAVIIFVVFLSVFGYYVFSINVTEQDIKDYDNISKNPYEKYENMMRGAGIKNLMQNDEYKLFRYNNKLDNLIQKSSPSKRDDVFDETF